MSYERRQVEDFETVMNKDLYDNLQDGIDSLIEKTKTIEETLSEIPETVHSSNDDYAEIGIWEDYNPDNESRIGKFVEISTVTSGATIKIANSKSDIVGVVVERPAFSANASADKFDEEGNLLPKYAYVCLLGLATVYDGGTCTVNKRCMPNDLGNAEPSSNNMGYQVISRVDDTHIIIAVAPNSDMVQRITNDILNKMDKNNPTGTGSFSLNRKGDTPVGDCSFAEGYYTTASGKYSHSEGYVTEASGFAAHTEGGSTVASGNQSHAEGAGTTASGGDSHSEGFQTVASGNYSHSEGIWSKSSGDSSHAEGRSTTASGINSHAEGYLGSAFGNASHVEGYGQRSVPSNINNNSTIEEILNSYDPSSSCFSLAKGEGAHVEGLSNLALNIGAHAEGAYTKAIGIESHAEGYYTTSSGNSSHAEGAFTESSGEASHAEGYQTVASGNNSHSSGRMTIASGLDQTVIGRGNIVDPDKAFIVGNSLDPDNRSNALDLDWDGNLQVAGDVRDGEGHSLTVLSKDLPFPLAIQNGVYGYIKREEGADTFVPFNNKLYITVQNKLANKLTVLSTFSCTESSEKYNITVIPSLTPTEQNTTV